MSATEQTTQNGIESKIEGLGLLYLIVSIGGAIASIILSQMDRIKNEDLSTILIGIGISCLLQGIIFWSLVRAGGEIIRLLKKLNHIPYDGIISGETEGLVCGECGANIIEGAKSCPECGAIFEEE